MRSSTPTRFAYRPSFELLEDRCLLSSSPLTTPAAEIAVIGVHNGVPDSTPANPGLLNIDFVGAVKNASVTLTNVTLVSAQGSIVLNDIHLNLNNVDPDSQNPISNVKISLKNVVIAVSDNLVQEAASKNLTLVGYKANVASSTSGSGPASITTGSDLDSSHNHGAPELVNTDAALTLVVAGPMQNVSVSLSNVKLVIAHNFIQVGVGNTVNLFADQRTVVAPAPLPGWSGSGSGNFQQNGWQWIAGWNNCEDSGSANSQQQPAVVSLNADLNLNLAGGMQNVNVTLSNADLEINDNLIQVGIGQNVSLSADKRTLILPSLPTTANLLTTVENNFFAPQGSTSPLYLKRPATVTQNVVNMSVGLNMSLAGPLGNGAAVLQGINVIASNNVVQAGAGRQPVLQAHDRKLVGPTGTWNTIPPAITTFSNPPFWSALVRSGPGNGPNNPPPNLDPSLWLAAVPRLTDIEDALNPSLTGPQNSLDFLLQDVNLLVLDNLFQSALGGLFTDTDTHSG